MSADERRRTGLRSAHMRLSTPRFAAVLALALAFVELANAATVQVPISPVVFAVGFVVTARLIAVRSAKAPVLLGALCALELLLLPGYARYVPVDWALQGTTAALALAGLAFSLAAVVMTGRRIR